MVKNPLHKNFFEFLYKKYDNKHIKTCYKITSVLSLRVSKIVPNLSCFPLACYRPSRACWSWTSQVSSQMEFKNSSLGVFVFHSAGKNGTMQKPSNDELHALFWSASCCILCHPTKNIQSLKQALDILLFVGFLSIFWRTSSHLGRSGC